MTGKSKLYTAAAVVIMVASLVMGIAIGLAIHGHCDKPVSISDGISKKIQHLRDEGYVLDANRVIYKLMKHHHLSDNAFTLEEGEKDNPEWLLTLYPTIPSTLELAQKMKMGVIDRNGHSKEER